MATLFHFSLVLVCLYLSSGREKASPFHSEGVNIVDSVVWSFLYIYIPFTIPTVNSTSTVSVSKLVQIKPKRKSHIGLISFAIYVMIMFIFKHFLFCESFDATINQLNPCFNISWKSNGWLFMMCLTLNLSLNFIVTDFGELIAFPLNVTLTSFQSTSNILQM